MDKIGENKSLEKSLNSLNNDLNIEIEYTARKIPQQNLPVEQAFTIIYGRAKAIFI